jgi:ankyrin repeat protein
LWLCILSCWGVKVLCQHGADLEQTDVAQRTALHWAAQYGRKEVRIEMRAFRSAEGVVVVVVVVFRLVLIGLTRFLESPAVRPEPAAAGSQAGCQG